MDGLKFLIQKQETTEILVQTGILDTVDTVLKNSSYTSFVILCDKTTESLFIPRLISSLEKLQKPIHRICVQPGEQSKNFNSVEQILNTMLEKNVDRKSALIVLGGGVIGDVGTTAAGLYYRGIDCIQIPTTLLSMVDSAMGGKGAVNIKTHKNSIGIIRQPRYIIMDPSVTAQLPHEQITSAMGEIIKYAIAMDKNLFEELEQAETVSDLVLDSIIKRCVQLKMTIVEKDSDDRKGIREVLNFGHTIGQAVELLAHIPHGYAIAIGMTFVLRLSQKKGLIQENELNQCLTLLEKYHLPTTIGNLDPEKILSQLKKDKKTVNGNPRFVLIKGIGEAVTGKIIDDTIISETLAEVLR